MINILNILNIAADIILFITACYYYFGKNKKKKKLLIIIGAICLPLWIVTKAMSSPQANEFACDKSWYPYNKEKIYGVVIGKSLKYTRRYNPHFIIKDISGNRVDTIYINQDTSKTIRLINENDTLYKMPNNDSLFKSINGKLLPLGELNCGCDTNYYKKMHGNMPDGHKWR